MDVVWGVVWTPVLAASWCTLVAWDIARLSPAPLPFARAPVARPTLKLATPTTTLKTLILMICLVKFLAPIYS